MSLNGASQKKFEEWCQYNGYPDYEEWIDTDEQPYKRIVNCTFYLQHENGTYAMFSCSVDYDWGADYFNLEKDNLIREEVQVTKTEIHYRENS